jgi:hypothetical protein
MRDVILLLFEERAPPEMYLSEPVNLMFSFGRAHTRRVRSACFFSGELYELSHRNGHAGGRALHDRDQ